MADAAGDLAGALRMHNRPTSVRPGPARTGARRAAMGYPSEVSFSNEDLALLERTEEVEIETRAPDGPVHRTVIWIVVDDGDVFIRSVRGATARWYREATANPAVAVHVAGRRLTATAIPATDPDSIDRATAGLRRSYASDPALRTMIRPEVLDTTLRLEPT